MTGSQLFFSNKRSPKKIIGWLIINSMLSILQGPIVAAEQESRRLFKHPMRLQLQVVVPKKHLTPIKIDTPQHIPFKPDPKKSLLSKEIELLVATRKKFRHLPLAAESDVDQTLSYRTIADSPESPQPSCCFCQRWFS